ncbi:MAG: HNH endonuclease [Pseudanabaena sp. ELA607]
MTNRKSWSRKELMIAMNLYCKLPFGQLHYKTPLIIAVAQKLERTPSSLAMKLTNFASLDPELQSRGIKGLKGASKADQAMWTEFNRDWERLGCESEEQLDLLLGAASEKLLLNDPAPLSATKSTESIANVKVRIGQKFFRQTILTNYYGRCCITGNPIPELLVASHILPWNKYPEHRLNPHNGLCLSKTQDAAFDQGLITIDSSYRIVLSSYLKQYLSERTLDLNFGIYAGQEITHPEKFNPDLDFLKYHREEIFID